MPEPRSRKRTRSQTTTNNDEDPTSSSSASASSSSSSSSSTSNDRPNAPKRRRNHSNETNNTNNYSLRSRTSNVETTDQDTTTNRSRYNFRPRRPPPAAAATTTTTTTTTRQYRLLYISDDDDPSSSSHDETTTRSTSTSTDRSSSSSTSDFANAGVAHVRLNRAIEIVIDSIQSLEGAVNNFDQLVFGLIYGRLSSRTEFESIEGMLRLSRILNFNFSSRLSQAEIDALPTIKFNIKLEPLPSVLLMEKCPICLTEFLDQEVINKLHCTHLFHRQCISTWLCENDSCPTCRRKVNQQNI